MSSNVSMTPEEGYAILLQKLQEGIPTKLTDEDEVNALVTTLETARVALESKSDLTQKEQELIGIVKHEVDVLLQGKAHQEQKRRMKKYT